MTGARVKPVLFVVATLFFWWLIATSAFITATCIPEGRRCVLSGEPVAAVAPASTLHLVGEAAVAGPPAGEDRPQTQTATTPRRWRDYFPMPSKRDVLVFVSLLAALWVAKALVYPYDDLSKASA